MKESLPTVSPVQAVKFGTSWTTPISLRHAADSSTLAHWFLGRSDRSILARFDCDLSCDVHDPVMKQADLYLNPEANFSQELDHRQRKEWETTARQPQAVQASGQRHRILHDGQPSTKVPSATASQIAERIRHWLVLDS
ncbi:MAG: hypothetical protein ACYC3X_15390 [Pirellulaceae bacterium]